MKPAVTVLIFLVAALSATAERARFDNYRLYSIAVENLSQLNVLHELSETSDSYSFVNEPQALGSDVDVIVPPHKFADFSELVERFQLKTTLNSENFQDVIDMESPRRAPKAVGDLDWESYHSTSAIYDWLDKLQSLFPQFITVVELGKTYQGKPLKLVKLSKKSGNRAIFIEANIHSREWIAGATATYVLNELLYSTDPTMQELAENIDWYFVPIANPDGYEYSRTTNRNWRKTRSVVSSFCYGVDPNRNWAFNWLTPDEEGNLGASRSPCSDLFAGPSAFSEPETAAIEDFLKDNHSKFDIYLSFHSYGHMLLFPFGHTRVRVYNYFEHSEIGKASADKLYSVNGIQYRVGSIIETLYAASGGSADHAFGYHRIPISYTYEMRGNGVYGNYGFVLPPHLIIPNAQEVVASLVGMVEKSREFGYLKNQ